MRHAARLLNGPCAQIVGSQIQVEVVVVRSDNRGAVVTHLDRTEHLGIFQPLKRKVMQDRVDQTNFELLAISMAQQQAGGRRRLDAGQRELLWPHRFSSFHLVAKKVKFWPARASASVNTAGYSEPSISRRDAR